MQSIHACVKCAGFVELSLLFKVDKRSYKVVTQIYLSKQLAQLMAASLHSTVIHLTLAMSMGMCKLTVHVLLRTYTKAHRRTANLPVLCLGEAKG